MVEAPAIEASQSEEFVSFSSHQILVCLHLQTEMYKRFLLQFKISIIPRGNSWNGFRVVVVDVVVVVAGDVVGDGSVSRRVLLLGRLVLLLKNVGWPMVELAIRGILGCCGCPCC